MAQELLKVGQMKTLITQLGSTLPAQEGVAIPDREAAAASLSAIEGSLDAYHEQLKEMCADRRPHMGSNAQFNVLGSMEELAEGVGDIATAYKRAGDQPQANVLGDIRERLTSAFQKLEELEAEITTLVAVLQGYL